MRGVPNLTTFMLTSGTLKFTLQLSQVQTKWPFIIKKKELRFYETETFVWFHYDRCLVSWDLRNHLKLNAPADLHVWYTLSILKTIKHRWCNSHPRANPTIRYIRYDNRISVIYEAWTGNLNYCALKKRKNPQIFIFLLMLILYNLFHINDVNDATVDTVRYNEYVL